MAVPLWSPGTLYQPGDLVQPVTAPPATAAQVVNGDFAAGNTNWDFTGGAEFATTGGYSNNGPCVRMPGTVAEGLALNRTQLVVPSTGSTFEASAMIQQGASIAGATRGWVEVRWYNASNLLLSSERGNVISDGSGGAWHQSKVTATRPAGAAYARAGIALFSVADHTHPIWGDNLVVSGTFAGLPDGLVYRAVQDESGYSASTEPAWPPILGQQVIDNDVIWEAVASTRVTWEASPLYVSGNTEPAWPTDVGGFVRDGTINWKTVSRRVEDENCPNTKIVVIGASKVYAADDDIIKYSATVNPLDWTSADDAGYLPFGLQNYGANPVAAMGLYRSNLIPFNAEAFQLWQIDEDPASMALVDALPLGSTQHQALAAVSNDLFFLSSQGVRTVGIAASSTNFQAGDVGMPIDPLVQEILATGLVPMALYYPAQGQYWLMFPKKAPPPVSEWVSLEDSGLGVSLSPDMGGMGQPGSSTTTMADSAITLIRTGAQQGGGVGWGLTLTGTGSVRLRLTCENFAAADGATVNLHVVDAADDRITLNASPTPTTAFAPSQFEFEVSTAGLGAAVFIDGLRPVKAHQSRFKIEVKLLDQGGGGGGGGEESEGDRTDVFVYTMTRVGQVGAWSRYVFPFAVDDWAIRGDDLYLRSGNYIHRMDDEVVGDEVAPGEIVPFGGMIQWPWLDFGQPGLTKSLYGFDMVGIGDVAVEFGYDQSNGGAFTDPYTVPADTVPGMVIPMPISAPSFSVRLRYSGTEQWQWNAFSLYLQDLRGMA